MTKFKTLATTALAATMIGAGGLATAPTASAAISCSHAMNLHRFYMATGDVFFAHGNWAAASMYYGRAAGVMEGACKPARAACPAARGPSAPLVCGTQVGHVIGGDIHGVRGDRPRAPAQQCARASRSRTRSGAVACARARPPQTPKAAAAPLSTLPSVRARCATRALPPLFHNERSIGLTTLAAPAPPTARRPPAPSSPPASRFLAGSPSSYDGEPLRHLSHSSYSKFLLCPDDWRRHYLKGERPPPSGHMFLGGRVDDALSTYYRHLLEHGERLTLEQVHDAYRDHWTRELADEARQARRALGPRLDEAARVHARPAGGRARRCASSCRGSADRSPSSASSTYALAPGLEWTIQGFLDLETLASR